MSISSLGDDSFNTETYPCRRIDSDDTMDSILAEENHGVKECVVVGIKRDERAPTCSVCAAGTMRGNA